MTGPRSLPAAGQPDDGEDVTPAGRGSRVRGEDVTPVGRRTRVRGEGASPVGRGSRVRGEDVTPVGRRTSVRAEGASPVGRRTRVRGEDIVTVAAGLFARDGYHNVGMRAVAEALGIRGASLYHHHSSKEEILYAIALSVSREPVQNQLPLLDAAGTPAQRLALLVRAHVEHLCRRRVEHLVGLQEMSSLTPEHRAEVDGYRRWYQRRVTDVITAGVHAGELDVADPRLAALAAMDMLNGISRWFSGQGTLTVGELADGYVDLVVGGLLRGPRAPVAGPLRAPSALLGADG